MLDPPFPCRGGGVTPARRCRTPPSPLPSLFFRHRRRPPPAPPHSMSTCRGGGEAAMGELGFLVFGVWRCACFLGLGSSVHAWCLADVPGHESIGDAPHEMLVLRMRAARRLSHASVPRNECECPDVPRCRRSPQYDSLSLTLSLSLSLARAGAGAPSI